MHTDHMAASSFPDEAALRERLGIPKDARKVLIMAESSHWDPQWLLDTETYYRTCIVRVFKGILSEFRVDPRRTFAIESVLFLKMFWERNPGKQEELRSLINSGRLILTGTAMGQPDTNLPLLESILRDYQIGQQWLRDNGIQAEPDIAAFADNFGHSPALPTILNSLGFRYTSFARVDGGYYEGCDFRPESDFPMPGSTAEILLKKLQSLDFIWRTADGAELRCLFMPYTYGMGDDLTINPAWLLPGLVSRQLFIKRWCGIIFGIPSRSENQIAGRVKEYVDRLAPLSRTDYLFCPTGYDFNPPLPGLMKLIDRYNRKSYPQTGIYLISATLKDYFDLTSDAYKDLPVLQDLDINPVSMGCASSRPYIKQLCHQLVKDLVTAETLNVTGPNKDQRHAKMLKQAWEAAAESNHHDFITGTSTNSVVYKCQLPLLQKAQSKVDSVLNDLVASLTPIAAANPAPRPPEWSQEGSLFKVRNQYYALTLDRDKGGCIVEWLDMASNKSILKGPANDLILYRDSGGLWRLPWEYPGGLFAEVTRASTSPCLFNVGEKEGILEARIVTDFEGVAITRLVRFRTDSPYVEVTISGSTKKDRTVVCCFPLHSPGRISMDVPGAVVTRPEHTIYDPTYWAAHSFVNVEQPNGHGMFVNFSRTASVSISQSGLQFIAVRNINSERTASNKVLMAFGAKGDTREQTISFAFCATPAAEPHGHGMTAASAQISEIWNSDIENRIGAAAKGAVIVDDAAVGVIGVKDAELGQGVIVHLFSDRVTGQEIRLRVKDRPILEAWSCDARERDIARIKIVDGQAVVPVTSPIICIRVHI
ncbi:MAG: hypothetical protein WC541_04130 [Dehalococcoidia bacterium]